MEICTHLGILRGQMNLMMVHLLNLTNPMMRGPLREFILISSLRANVRLPADRRVTTVYLPVAGNKVPITKKVARLWSGRQRQVYARSSRSTLLPRYAG
jgi:hypothetical protein